MAYWLPVLGWGLFWVSLILGIVLFAVKKKIYPVIYVISIALYIFTAGFLIDEFKLQKGGILMTLIFSAVIFMLAGYYFSRVMKDDSAPARK